MSELVGRVAEAIAAEFRGREDPTHEEFCDAARGAIRAVVDHLDMTTFGINPPRPVIPGQPDDRTFSEVAKEDMALGRYTPGRWLLPP